MSLKDNSVLYNEFSTITNIDGTQICEVGAKAAQMYSTVTGLGRIWNFG